MPDLRNALGLSPPRPSRDDHLFLFQNLMQMNEFNNQNTSIHSYKRIIQSKYIRFSQYFSETPLQRGGVADAPCSPPWVPTYNSLFLTFPFTHSYLIIWRYQTFHSSPPIRPFFGDPPCPRGLCVELPVSRRVGRVK